MGRVMEAEGRMGLLVSSRVRQVESRRPPRNPSKRFGRVSSTNEALKGANVQSAVVKWSGNTNRRLGIYCNFWRLVVCLLDDGMNCHKQDPVQLAEFTRAESN